MTNYWQLGPQIAVRGVRATIPTGYILGRTSAGPGPAELIPINGQGGIGTRLQNNGAIPTRLTQLADVGIVSLADKQRFRYSASLGKWTNIADTLANLTDVNTTGLTTGQLLQFNGTAWVPHTPLLSEDGDVAISSPANLQVLQYNSGTGKWANATISVSATLAGLTDVQLTSLADGNILQYNAASSKWKNVAIATGTQICLQVSLQANQTAAANNTDTVVQYTLPTTDLQSAWSNTLFKWTPTVAGLYMVLCHQVVDTISGNFGAIAIRKNGTILAKDTALSGAASTIGLEVTLPISMNGTTDFIDIVAQGSNAGGNPTFYSVSPRPNLIVLQFGVSAGGGSSTLAGDTDVAITSPANNDLLQYNSGTGKWTNVAVTLSASFSGLTDVTVSTPVSNDVPVYDTGSSKWKNQPVNVEAFRVKPPAVATLTTRPGTGTIADSTYGFTITEVLTAANTNSLYYAVTPITRGATNTFTFTIRLRKHFGSYAWVMPGMILRDSVGGTSLIMSNGWDSCLGFNKNHFSNDTTFLAVFGAYAWNGGPPLDWWMRLVDDNTTRTWFYSANGSDWVSIYSEAKSVFCSAANQVGVHINPNAGSASNQQNLVQGKNAMLECLSWQQVAS